MSSTSEPSDTPNKMPFEEWEDQLSDMVFAMTGVPLDGGEDVPTYDWWVEDYTLMKARDKVLIAWGWQQDDNGNWHWFK